MADFIEYTDEIFPRLKHLKGVCVEGKEQYYLSKSHALYDYVQKSRNGFDVNFTSANMDMFINKMNYFLYPDKRSKSDNANLKDRDISVDDFSLYCVNMFYKRFGIDFNFLRITSDKTNTDFVEEQKHCLVHLFSQCLYWLKKVKKTDENVWDELLRIFYRDLRFQLSKIDIIYLIREYNPFLPYELREYAQCSIIAYHKLKKLYMHANYVLGNDELVNEMQKFSNEQLKKSEDTVRLISSLVSAENKQDIKAVVEGLCFKNPPPISQAGYGLYIRPTEFEDFYLKLDDKNEYWRKALIDKWMSCIWSEIGEKLDTSVLMYAMYKENEQDFYNKYISLCAELWQIKNEKKEAYWNVLTEKVLNFESRLNSTAVCLFFYKTNEDGEEE